MKDISVIPEGMYCYTADPNPNGIASEDDAGNPMMNIKPCPYWSLVQDKPSQENGHCSFLNRGDWEGGNLSLLWDMVKECGIKNDWHGE